MRLNECGKALAGQLVHRGAPAEQRGGSRADREQMLHLPLLLDFIDQHLFVKLKKLSVRC